jgi:hypothetical protein
LELPTPSTPGSEIIGLDGFWDYNNQTREVSPIFQSAREAVDWGLARSRKIYLRLEPNGVTYWVGSDPCPADFEQLTVREAEEIFARIIGTFLPLTDSSEANRRREADRLKVLRESRGLSVLEIAERSLLSPSSIEAIEDCSGPYESSPKSWIDLVRAICNVHDDHPISGGWVIEEGGMLSVALRACGLDESGEPLEMS